MATNRDPARLMEGIVTWKWFISITLTAVPLLVGVPIGYFNHQLSLHQDYGHRGRLTEREIAQLEQRLTRIEVRQERIFNLLARRLDK